MILLTRTFYNCHWRDLHNDRRWRRNILEPLIKHALELRPLFMSHLRYKDGHLLRTASNHLSLACEETEECCSTPIASVSITGIGPGSCCSEFDGTYAVAATPVPAWVPFPPNCAFYNETLFPTGDCSGGCEVIGDAHYWPLAIRIIATNSNGAYFGQNYTFEVNMNIAFARWDQAGMDCNFNIVTSGSDYLYGENPGTNCTAGTFAGTAGASLWGGMTACDPPTVTINT